MACHYESRGLVQHVSRESVIMKKKVYALYKGDRLLACGTLMEFVRMGYNVRHLQSLKTPSRIAKALDYLDNHKSHGGMKYLIELEENENE